MGVPLHARAAIQFLEQDGRAALVQEERGKAGVGHVVVPGAVRLLLGHQQFRPLAVPVVVAEVLVAGGQPRPLGRVEPVEVPLVGLARVGGGGEPLGEPPQGQVDAAVQVVLVAAGLAVAARAPARQVEHVADDVDARQAGRRHGAVAGAAVAVFALVRLAVVPGPVAVLQGVVEVLRPFPDDIGDLDAGLVGLPEGEDGHLGVGEIEPAEPVVQAVVVPPAVDALGLDEPLHIGLQGGPDRIALGAAGPVEAPLDDRQGHDPQRHDVGLRHRQRLRCHRRGRRHHLAVGVLADVRQRQQGHGAAAAGVGLLLLRPDAALALVDEPFPGLLDGAVHVLIADGLGGRGPAGPAPPPGPPGPG